MWIIDALFNVISYVLIAIAAIGLGALMIHMIFDDGEYK